MLGNLREIFYTIKQRECSKNQYIFREGEISDEIFLILKGDFVICKDKIVSNPPHSKNLICKTFQIHRLKAGQMFGEEDMYESQNRSYDVQCVSKNGLLWVITPQNVLVHNRDILKYLNSTVKQRLIYYEGKLRDLMGEYNTSHLSNQIKTQSGIAEQNLVNRKIKTEMSTMRSGSINYSPFERPTNINKDLVNVQKIDNIVNKILNTKNVEFQSSKITQRPSPIPNNLNTNRNRQSPPQIQGVNQLQFSNGKSFQKKFSFGSEVSDDNMNKILSEDDQVIEDNLKFQLNKTFRELNQGKQTKHHSCASRSESRNCQHNDKQKQKVILSMTTFNDFNSKMSIQAYKKNSVIQSKEDVNGVNVKNDIISLVNIQSEIGSSSGSKMSNNDLIDSIETDSKNIPYHKEQSIKKEQINIIVQDKKQQSIQENKDINGHHKINDKNGQDQQNDKENMSILKQYEKIEDFFVANNSKINTQRYHTPSIKKANKKFNLPKISPLSYYNSSPFENTQQSIQNSIKNSMQNSSSSLKRKYYHNSLQISPIRQRMSSNAQQISLDNDNINNQVQNNINNDTQLFESLYNNNKLKKIILHNYIGKIQKGQFPIEPQRESQQQNAIDFPIDQYNDNQKAKMTYLNNIYTRIKTVGNDQDTQASQNINFPQLEKNRKYSLQIPDGLNKFNNIIDKYSKRNASIDASPNFEITAFDQTINTKINVEQIHKNNIHKKLKKLSDKLQSTKTNVLYIMHPNSFYIH